jgi:hypothetical protein
VAQRRPHASFEDALMGMKKSEETKHGHRPSARYQAEISQQDLRAEIHGHCKK